MAASRRNLLFVALALLACCAVGIIASLRKEPTRLSQARTRFEADPQIDASPFAPRRKVAADHLFERLAPSETGLHFINTLDDDDVWGKDFRVVLNGSLGSGTCVGDFDADGLADVYLVGRESPNRLFRQIRPFEFVDVTAVAGVDGGAGTCSGASFVDIDNDGDLDLYLCKYDAPNCLYVNDGNGAFHEAAAAYQLDFRGASVMSTFVDYDRDGDLDMFLLTNRLFLSDRAMQQAKSQIKAVNGKPFVPPEVQEVMYFAEHQVDGKPQYIAVPAGQRDRLFRNDGDGTFTDVTRDAGFDGCFRGHSATWWDFDNDNWLDVYIANDFFDPDQLFRNNGDGTFTDVTAKMLPHTPWFSMGADAADINNDGLIDLLATDMSATTHFKHTLSMGSMSEQRWFLESAEPRQYMRNALYLNTGTERFMEVAQLAGLDSTDWTWSVKFCDIDNDGRTDVFFTNGMIRNTMDSDLRDSGAQSGAQRNRSKMGNLLRESEPLKEANLAFRNLGDLKFENVAAQWGLDDVTISSSAVFADLDNDGDQDLIVNNYNEPTAVYENRSKQSNAICIQLEGTQSNRFGVGATVRVEAGAGVQVRRNAFTRGYMSSEEPELHFGFGNAIGGGSEHCDATVTWPSGHVQKFESLPLNFRYRIREPALPVVSPSANVGKTDRSDDTWFEDVSTAMRPVFRHSENSFDDFADQPLLPYRLSRVGGGVACADIDGDGDTDAFVGGAAGQSGGLYLNDGDGVLQLWDGPWKDDKACEDMSPLIFDADGDGDFDLLVTSGGVEVDQGDELLRNRLYENVGDGRFVAAQRDALPDQRVSSSVAATADFDNDGDLDLFLGGRVVPGRYPDAPSSSLLRNDQGKFTDVTEELAPELGMAGLVTGGIWSDYNDDGKIDLLVSTEWGPVKVFENTGAGFKDRTDAAGLGHALGWWNGIVAGDLDRDGDIDYVATNFGHNTKYSASAERPAILFYGDLVGGGKRHIVEAAFEGEHLYPVRGKSCSTTAMPALATRFSTYRAFASAELDAIYSPEHLANAKRFEATTLDSVAIMNTGDGQFTIRPLPTLAQASPCFGAVIRDFDGDGYNDVYLAQNFFSPQPETGQMDGGLSLLMKGGTDGNLRPVASADSGLVIPGDAKGVATADFDGDGSLDVMIAQNNDEVRLMQNQKGSSSSFAVRLRGRLGNPSAIGAKVVVRDANGTLQAAEVYGGSGYLSQSTPGLFFARGADSTPPEITVRWPSGRESIHSLPTNEKMIELVEQE